MLCKKYLIKFITRVMSQHQKYSYLPHGDWLISSGASVLYGAYNAVTTLMIFSAQCKVSNLK